MSTHIRPSSALLLQLASSSAIGAKVAVVVTLSRPDAVASGISRINSSPQGFSAAVASALAASGFSGVSVTSGAASVVLPSPPPPPPPSPPLRLPPFPPAPALAAQVTASLRIVGYGPADFGDTQRYQALRALASALRVGVSALSLGPAQADSVPAPPAPPPVVAVSPPPPPLPSRPPPSGAAGRRALLQATLPAVRLSLVVTAASRADAASAAAALAASAADGSLLAALRAAGLAAARGAEVLSQISVLAPPMPPPQPQPEPDWLTRVRLLVCPLFAQRCSIRGRRLVPSECVC